MSSSRSFSKPPFGQKDTKVRSRPFGCPTFRADSVKSLWKSAIYGQHYVQMPRSSSSKHSPLVAARIRISMPSFMLVRAGTPIAFHTFIINCWPITCLWRSLTLTQSSRNEYDEEKRNGYSLDSVVQNVSMFLRCAAAAFAGAQYRW